MAGIVAAPKCYLFRSDRRSEAGHGAMKPAGEKKAPTSGALRNKTGISCGYLVRIL